MKLKELTPVLELFGDCRITPFNNGVVIVDKKAEPIGQIDFYTGTFTLYEDYTHADEVEHKMNKKGIELFDRGLNRELLHAV